MRDKADVAQFKFPINVAKSIFLIEIPKVFTASPCIFNKNVFWVWKVFLQTGNSVGLTLAGWRKGRQGATWVAIPLPGASFQELFSLPGHPLAPGRFLPATTFSVGVFDYMLHHGSGRRLLVWSDIQWCNTLRVKVEKTFEQQQTAHDQFKKRSESNGSISSGSLVWSCPHWQRWWTVWPKAGLCKEGGKWGAAWWRFSPLEQSRATGRAGEERGVLDQSDRSHNEQVRGEDMRYNYTRAAR